MEDSLAGLADADARLGRPFPLPAVALPLPRWVDVRAVGAGAEVVWSLDDTRPGAPGRLALHAAPEPPAPRELAWDAEERVDELAPGTPATLRTAALAEAEPSLRPVRELTWSRRRPAPAPDRARAPGPWTTCSRSRARCGRPDRVTRRGASAPVVDRAHRHRRAACSCSSRVFLPWYGTDSSNPNVRIDGSTATFSGWDVAPDPALAAAARPRSPRSSSPTSSSATTSSPGRAAS